MSMRKMPKAIISNAITRCCISLQSSFVNDDQCEYFPYHGLFDTYNARFPPRPCSMAGTVLLTPGKSCLKFLRICSLSAGLYPLAGTMHIVNKSGAS